MRKTVSICGTRYTIELYKHRAFDNDGLMDPESKALVVRQDCQDPGLSLFHEVLHAIFEETGATQLWNLKQEHLIISNLEKHLYPLVSSRFFEPFSKLKNGGPK